jgi:hypothetical protein
MRRAIVPILVAAAIVAIALFFPRDNQRRQEPTDPPPAAEDRIPKLTKLVAEQEEESAQAVAKYKPKIQARIDKLDSPVVDLLRQLPGVVHVEAGVKADKPVHRIIHLREWHFVPKDHYAVDMQNALGRELTAKEIDQLHQELILEVATVQLEQMALLRCLIKHHGLKRIFSEGLAPKSMPGFREQIAVYREMEETQIRNLRRQLAEVRRARREFDRELQGQVSDVETEILGLIDQHRLRLIDLGVPGMLLIAGEIDEVLPLEDADLFVAANPVTPDGKVKIDLEKLKARRDAQVKAVLDKGGVGLIVLGGSHDLSENVRRLGQGRCEYIRVTTRRFKEFGE